MAAATLTYSSEIWTLTKKERLDKNCRIEIS
jgi:hypothetical protein